MRNIFFVVFYIISLITHFSYAQVSNCGLKNFSFKEGEQLHFKIFYNMSPLWIQAGTADFNTYSGNINGQQAYHVVGIGKSLKSYDWFFKVYDVYETYIDKETMLPHRFIRNVNEGGFKIYNNISFNQEAKKAVSTNGTYQIPRCTQDVLSAVCFARNIDYNKLKPGTRVQFPLFLDDSVYSMHVRYMGKYEIETKLGRFKAIKIMPLLIQGTIFKGGEKMTVWVSDDNNHIPLRVESPILVGSIKVDLMGYSNLRYPLSSMIAKK